MEVVDWACLIEDIFEDHIYRSSAWAQETIGNEFITLMGCDQGSDKTDEEIYGILCSLIDINGLDADGQTVLTSLIDRIPSGAEAAEDNIDNATREIITNQFVNLYIKLVNLGADYRVTNVDGINAFEAACDNNHVPSSLITQLASIVDPNGRGICGMTPIMHTVGNLTAMETLISRGAFVNAVDDDGMTAIMHSRDSDTDEILFKHGADISVREYQGYTTLMLRAKLNNPAISPYIMDESIRYNLVNAVDRSGNNAFSHCCISAILHNNFFVDTAIPLIICGSEVV
jgi:hypothetical protein